MSKTAKITLHPELEIGEIDVRVYGSFVEHLGRCIYEGIYEPGHPTADSEGFRGDVLELVRKLQVPIVRFPGGNFVSAYNWEDGVGPVEKRPRRLEIAWRAIETNQFGLNEFMSWCAKAGTQPMYTVNLGTRGIDAARNVLEYCNHPGGAYWSDLRKSHGVAEPYKIRIWCLGNEMDGPWQMGHKTATEYGRLANETAKVMRQVDPDIELVACGSSNSRMDTYPEWNATVLDNTYEHVDFISIHDYYGRYAKNIETFLAQSVDMDRYIKTIIATCDYVKAKKRSRKTVNISFDEWNVIFHYRKSRPPQIEPWGIAQARSEAMYSVVDAVVFGSLIITLLKHADRVKMACQALLVNVIGLIVTQPGGACWRQTIYYPFLHASVYGRGRALSLNVKSPTYEDDEFGTVPFVDGVAVANEEEETITIFAINRSLEDDIVLDGNAADYSDYFVCEHSILANDDISAGNTAANPDNVIPKSNGNAHLADGKLIATLPKVSWNVIRLGKKGQ